MRVARSRAVVAAGYRPAVVARVARVSRQALYRRRSRRPAAAGPGRAGPDDHVIVEVAKANPTDGTRMVAALASRELGRSVNRKRVQRVMRAHRLLQPSRSGDRRRRPGFFRVTRPDALWHLDMTKVWTAQHGCVYLHAIVDCSHPRAGRLVAGAALPRRRGDRLRRGRGPGPRRAARPAHPRHRHSNSVCPGLRIVRPVVRGSWVTGACPSSLDDRLERVRLLAR